MKKLFLAALILICIISLSACDVGVNKLNDSAIERINSKAIVCNEPYIRYGASCCLDQNDNIICDEDEAVGEQEEAEELIVDGNNIKENVESYGQLHWENMPVTYYITKEICENYETNKIKKGFAKIQDVTNEIVYFKEVKDSKEANIYIHCSFLEDCYKYEVDIRENENMVYKYETICEHDKGLAQITELDGTKIVKADIEMIGLAGFTETDNEGMSGFFVGSCGWPTVEIHEILHTFGYQHDNNPSSIMYESVEGSTYRIKKYYNECYGSDIPIDEWIVEDLIDTYKDIS